MRSIRKGARRYKINLSLQRFLILFTVFLYVALAAFALWLVGFLYLSILMIGCVIFKQTFTSILH